MKYLLVLAYKNLTRYKRRTFITAGAIAYGLAMFIFMDSLLIGAEKISEKNLFEYETGSAQIYAPGYYKNRLQLPAKNLIKEPLALIKQLNEAGIDNAVARLVTGTEVINPKNSSGMRAMLFGIDPAVDDEVFSFAPTISEGRYLRKGDYGVVMGHWLAQKLNVGVGDSLLIQYNQASLYDKTRDQWLQGSFQTLDLEVIGLVKTGNPIVNRNYIMIDKMLLDEEMEANGAASMVVLRVPDNAKGDKLLVKAQQIAKNFFGLSTEAMGENKVSEEVVYAHWKELVASYLALTVAKRGSSNIILVLIALIAAVGISNTMMMSVVERKREVGMMRAMGFTRSQIMKLFVLEATGIGILGALIGLFLAILINIWMVNWGIDLGFILRDFDVGYRIADVFKGAWNIPAMIISAIFTITISAIFAIFPVWKMLRQDIPQTLRIE